jgi:hypothetical protein
MSETRFGWKQLRDHAHDQLEHLVELFARVDQLADVTDRSLKQCSRGSVK